MSLLTEENQNSGLDKKIQAAISAASQQKKNEVKEVLYQFLQEAAVTEHLLAMQYLFACFSMKKYPEEFSDYKPGPVGEEQKKINNARLAQLEVMRRWEANMLMVAREEMTHLCYVMNLLAIIDRQPYLFRPNYPVPPDKFPLKKPVNLMPFSRAAVEIFRYWEKPSHIPVPDPLKAVDVPEHIRSLFASQNNSTDAIKGTVRDNSDYQVDAMEYLLDVLTGKLASEKKDKVQDPLGQGTNFDSIEMLYQFIRVFFYYGLKYSIFEGMNMERIVDEHYGFNMNLDPLVLGQYDSYVEAAIQQIIEEGEGVGGIPPPLGSHFWVYQSILDEFDQQAKGNLRFEPGLPVVWNPTTVASVTDRHLVSSLDNGSNAVIQVTNTIARDAMDLFNLCYKTVIEMLNGFFAHYSINQTTGIHPPQVNAYFQTAFYPFMTMIFRPLGELICRLPADAGVKPEPGKLPSRTAGPDFFMDVNQFGAEERMKHTQVTYDLQHYLTSFKEMEGRASKLAQQCREQGYHVANFGQPDARDFDVCFVYIAECFHRIAQNFQAYWEGKMVAPVSSKGFQNYSSSYN